MLQKAELSCEADSENHLDIEFISCRENIDTTGPLGRAMVVIVGAINELERSLIIERVRAAPSWRVNTIRRFQGPSPIHQ